MWLAERAGSLSLERFEVGIRCSIWQSHVNGQLKVLTCPVHPAATSVQEQYTQEDIALLGDYKEPW